MMMYLYYIIVILARMMVEIFGKYPETEFLVVNTGSSVELRCKHDIYNIPFVIWSFVPFGKHEESVVYDLFQNDIHERYSTSCNSNEIFCNLTLIRASKDRAGKYLCRTSADLGENPVITAIVELVVGDLECLSNINKDRPMIGENTCDKIKPDILKKMCRFNFIGKPDPKLQFVWTAVDKYGKVIYKEIIDRQFYNTTTIEMKDELEVSSDMNDLSFKCHVKNMSHIKPCSLPQLKVFYVKQVTERQMINNPHDVNCSINQIENLQCSYSWQHDSFAAKNNSAILSAQDIKVPGTYICLAICKINAFKKCHCPSLKVEVVKEVSESSLPNEYTNLVRALCVLSIAFGITVIAMFAMIICWCFKSKMAKTIRYLYCKIRHQNDDVKSYAIENDSFTENDFMKKASCPEKCTLQIYHKIACTM